MTKKCSELWESLNVPVLVNKREMVLGIMVCTLAGILLGILFSPKKHTTIGSNNGNNSGNGALPDEEELEF